MAATPAVNIVIAQGTDFSETFTSTESSGSASNLIGYTASSQIKKFPDSTSSSSFSVSITGVTGEVTISMTSSVTSQLKPGRYYYDVLLTSPSNKVSRMVEGMALVTAAITT